MRQRREDREHRDHDGGRAGDHAGRVADAALDGQPRRQAAADVLADPAEHEHVVVHRQPDQDHHHEQRDPVDDEARAGEVERALDVAVLEHERQHAEGGADRGQVEHASRPARSARCGRRAPSSAGSAGARSRSRAAAGPPAGSRSRGTPRRRRRRRTPRRGRRARPAPGRRAAARSRCRPARRTRRTASPARGPRWSRRRRPRPAPARCRRSGRSPQHRSRARSRAAATASPVARRRP